MQTEISDCSYLVDSYFPGRDATDREPHYVLDESQWETLTCESFLDTAQTSLLGRLVWIPDLPFVPDRLRRKWGQYCLLRQRSV